MLSRFVLLAAPLAFAACGSSPPPASAPAPSTPEAPSASVAPIETAPPVASSPTAPSASAAPIAPKWSYDGDTGPSHWGAIDPSFATCASGTVQSPVALASSKVSAKAPAPPSWSPVPLHVVHTGHTIQVDDSAASSFVVDGATYTLKQFHFHSPSEHTLDGKAFDVEMHFVHKAADGKIAVVALFFNHGKASTLLSPVWDAMPSDPASAPVTSAATIDVQTLLPKAAKYLRYDGSLTAPPCSEGVKWLVVAPDARAPLTMSDAQIEKLKAALHGASNRPIQPLGGRTVVEVGP